VWYPPSGTPHSGKAESSHLHNVKHNIQKYGGRIETRPNPYYREPTGMEVLNKMLRKAFTPTRSR
jgi:hypothetical protein